MKSFYLDEVDSTQDYARKLLMDGECAPFFVLAREQHAGRGSRGREFFSPNGGMYLSVVISQNDLEYEFVTGFVAVCLVRTVQNFLDKASRGEVARVKWVNDIYVGARKVAGTIVRRVIVRGRGYFVIGCGINLKYDGAVPAWLSDIIGFLNIPDSPREVARKLIKEITSLKITNEELIKEYTRLSGIVGSNHARGEVVSINLDGSLVVRDKNGMTCTVYA